MSTHLRTQHEPTHSLSHAYAFPRTRNTAPQVTRGVPGVVGDDDQEVGMAGYQLKELAKGNTVWGVAFMLR